MNRVWYGFGCISDHKICIFVRRSIFSKNKIHNIICRIGASFNRMIVYPQSSGHIDGIGSVACFINVFRQA